MKRTLLVLLLTIFIFNKPAHAQDSYEISISKNVNISKAENYIREGNYDAALDVYNSILAANPNSIPARTGIAKVYTELFKLKAAQREFNKVLNQDPNNSDAHNGLGLTYYYETTSSNMDVRENIGELYNKAISEFKQSISINPRNDEAITNLGVIYQHQGRNDDAEMQFKTALEINPNNSNANYALGSLLFDKNYVDEAINSYQKAISLNTKNSSAHYKLGEALITKGRYSQAIEELQTSLYLNPISAPVHEKLGEAYKYQGNETAAIEEFKKAIAIKPEDTSSYLMLSSVYEARGDEELAIAELKSSLKNNANFTEGKIKIANLSLKLGKIDQAVEYYKQALLDDPGNPLVEKGLSKAYFKQVQTNVASGVVSSPAKLLEAEKLINKAIVTDPNDIELYYAKFKLEKMTNKPELTEDELRKMADLAPTNVPQTLEKGYAHFQLKDFKQANSIFRGAINQVPDKDDKLMVAETLIEYKDYEIADEIFNNILKEDPQNVQAQRGIEKTKKLRDDSQKNYRLGWDLFNRKQRKSALDQFNKSINVDPTNANAYYWAAETCNKDDQYKTAYEYYKNFLSLMEGINTQNADKELIKRRNNAEKMVKKLKDKNNEN